MKALQNILTETDQLDPAFWPWPPCPPSLRIFDKYSEQESVVRLGAREWVYSVQGRRASHEFSGDLATRLLQQKLIIFTQQNASPSSIYKFARTLLLEWKTFRALLAAGPATARRIWTTDFRNVDLSAAGKIMLKFACSSSVGPWRPLHLPLVKDLAANARPALINQQAKVERREKLLSVDVQAAIAQVLDQERSVSELTEDQLEGLAALALIFQHGVRPVQLLSLRLEHVDVHVVGSQVACIVSFHAAKKRGAPTYELARQVKPEWAETVVLLRALAVKKGRNKLFKSVNADALWANVLRISGSLANDKTFIAGWVRHTAAQSLADAGHDRESIREFLGQSNINSASAYIKASRQQSELINRALGASRLYTKIVDMSAGKFVTLAELLGAEEDKQIGGIVGDRLVAGIGLCRSGQSNCSFNPVTSCYGCPKFIPSLDRASHVEAISGMRMQVSKYLELGRDKLSPAALQLTRALSVAQMAVAAIDELTSRQ